MKNVILEVFEYVVGILRAGQIILVVSQQEIAEFQATVRLDFEKRIQGKKMMRAFAVGCFEDGEQRIQSIPPLGLNLIPFCKFTSRFATTIRSHTPSMTLFRSRERQVHASKRIERASIKDARAHWPTIIRCATMGTE